MMTKAYSIEMDGDRWQGLLNEAARDLGISFDELVENLVMAQSQGGPIIFGADPRQKKHVLLITNPDHWDQFNEWGSQQEWWPSGEDSS